jgi:hypothetical protein
MRNRGFFPKPHTVGDIAYIITGSETDDAHRMNGTRCRITADHGRGEYSWEVAPVTYSEIICLIEKLEREGKLPLNVPDDPWTDEHGNPYTSSTRWRWLYKDGAWRWRAVGDDEILPPPMRPIDETPLGTWGLCPWSGLQLTEHGKGRPGNLSCDVCDCSGFPHLQTIDELVTDILHGTLPSPGKEKGK